MEKDEEEGMIQKGRIEIEEMSGGGRMGWYAEDRKRGR